MGYINQASASVSDPTKISISIWVRLDAGNISDTEPSYVIEWGERAVNFSNSYIRFNILDTNEIEFVFSSRHNSLVESFPEQTWSYVPDGGSNVELVSAAHTVMVGGTITSSWVVGVWAHLLLAVDLSSGAADFNSTSPLYDSLIVKYSCAAAVNGSVVTVEKDVGIVQDDDTFQPGNDHSSVAVFPISIQGFEIGIPVQAADAATFNIGAKLADVQIWCGQYIDPATHIDKFISGGKPVNPSIAEAAFGVPDYRFSGPALGIGTNSGTGGDFTKVGTVTDFSPGP